MENFFLKTFLKGKNFIPVDGNSQQNPSLVSFSLEAKTKAHAERFQFDFPLESLQNLD